ncbi:TetR/AcrR family transcriptional regulator [Pseudooceanicola sp. C21-150M6]|uniref:TetR/AcrR family transcriptional regulator n=1 Tax=Pseudooceanicola sp. C21-150M6 TaxID=3434355 RepID=UPI003D7FC943
MSKSEEKRRQILMAATDEFQDHGFDGARMDRVADRAGVSKRTVYNHFDSKERLFSSIVESAYAIAEETRRYVFDPEKGLREQLLEIGQIEGRLLRSEELMKMARMGTGELMRTPDLAERLGLGPQPEDCYGDFFRAAAAAGRLRPDAPELAMTQFIGMIKAQAYWPAIFTGVLIGQNALDGIIETSVDTVMAAFAVPGA